MLIKLSNQEKRSYKMWKEGKAKAHRKIGILGRELIKGYGYYNRII